jgi:hypothetical protein
MLKILVLYYTYSQIYTMTTVETKNNETKNNETNHNSLNYAILMETSGSEYESWYYFIRYEGNEEALDFLFNQLDEIRWRIYSKYSTFDLELERLVSEQTATEMTLLNMNFISRHRRFDGKLDFISFGFEEGDKNKDKVKKVNKLLGFGAIGDYITEEFVHPDIIDEDLEESESGEEDGGSDYTPSSSEDEFTDTETSSNEESSGEDEIKEEIEVPTKSTRNQYITHMRTRLNMPKF